MQNNHPLHLFNYCPRCGSDKFQINDFKSKKCAHCGFVYYFNSSVSTAVFITDEEGKLLVARRTNEPAKGTLDLPGGFVDLHETAEEAIIREIKEETGLTLINPVYLFSIPNIYLYSGFEVHTLDLFFEAKLTDISGMQAADDVSELVWMERKGIDPQLFGLHSIRQAIEKWLWH